MFIPTAFTQFTCVRVKFEDSNLLIIYNIIGMQRTQKHAIAGSKTTGMRHHHTVTMLYV